MKYLVVGGLEVFSEALIECLLKKSDTELVAVTKDEDERQYEKNRLKWYDLNLNNLEDVAGVLNDVRPDVIYYLNVQDSVGQAWKNPNETVNINIIQTINVLNAVKDLDYKPRLIIAGSGEEYGDLGFDHLPLKENETPHPVNIFGATKACQTMFAKLYHRAYAMDVIVLRTFNETSPKQDDRWAISSFCKQFVKMERGEQPRIIHVGDTNIVRDFTDVDDLVRAFDLVTQKGKSGEVYNAARGEGVSITEIISLLEEITGIEVEVCTDKSKVRPVDIPGSIADVRKIKADTGWEATVDIRTTLEKLIIKWKTA
jgi:GDP-4-dehydro-6-deoxy-D-mannose reductase